jgi:hypothetical protein
MSPPGPPPSPLDAVDQQFPDGDGVLPQAYAQIRMLGQHGVVAACPRARSAYAVSAADCSATAPSKSASPAPYSFGVGAPGWIQPRQSALPRRGAGADRAATWSTAGLTDGQLFRVETLAFHQQGASVVRQVVLQRRQLAFRADLRRCCGDPHAGLPTCLGRRLPGSTVGVGRSPWSCWSCWSSGTWLASEFPRLEVVRDSNSPTSLTGR